MLCAEARPGLLTPRSPIIRPLSRAPSLDHGLSEVAEEAGRFDSEVRQEQALARPQRGLGDFRCQL